MKGMARTFQKFFTNKTTVTVVGVVLGIAVLVGFYTYRVQTEIKPVRVPIAKSTLTATTEITKDDIAYVKVSSDFLRTADIVTNVNDLIGKYVSTGTSISKGAMFYNTQVMEKRELPNSIFEQIPDGYTIYQLKVTNETPYANEIYPGDKIDLWLKTNEVGLLVYGKFISNIEVLAVRDQTGENIFDVTSDKSPNWLLFAVPTEMYRYLKIAEYQSDMSILPVPTNNYYVSESGTTEYSSDELTEMIKSRSMEMR